VSGDNGSGGLDERAVAVMVGEVKGMLTTVLQQLTEMSSRLRAVETSSESRISALERLAAEHGVRIATVERERRSDHDAAAAAARDEQSRRPSWWAIANGIAAIVAIVVALLSLGGVIHVG